MSGLGRRRVIERKRFAHWAEIKAAFNAVDKVGEWAVFDIGGNDFGPELLRLRDGLKPPQPGA